MGHGRDGRQLGCEKTRHRIQRRIGHIDGGGAVKNSSIVTGGAILNARRAYALNRAIFPSVHIPAEGLAVAVRAGPVALDALHRRARVSKGGAAAGGESSTAVGGYEGMADKGES